MPQIVLDDQTRIGKKHGTRYPWAKWFKQGKFRLFQGRDFTGRVGAMAQQCRNTAAKPQFNLRLQISIAQTGKFITVTVLGRRK